MSAKSCDKHGRWRNKVVAFRASPEEDALINSFARLSGSSKQEYIVSRLTNKDVVVQGNPRVYKALKGELARVLDELKRVGDGKEIAPELLETIQLIARIMDGMKEESDWKQG